MDVNQGQRASGWQPCGCKLAVPLTSEVECPFRRAKERTVAPADSEFFGYLLEVGNPDPAFLCSSLVKAVDCSFSSDGTSTVMINGTLTGETQT